MGESGFESLVGAEDAGRVFDARMRTEYNKHCANKGITQNPSFSSKTNPLTSALLSL
jgi:hypothetical protein